MGGGADDYFAEHNEIRLDGDARSAAYLSFDDFRIEADVNLDAIQEEGEVIFKNYRVGFVEDLAE